MQYLAKNPTEYMKQLENDWRLEKLKIIRKMIKAHKPKLKEIISYKMLGYEYEGKVVMHLNAQKSYVGLYVSDIGKIDKEGTLLEGLDCGKGCIRFKKTSNIDLKKIKVVISRAFKISSKV